MKREKQNEIIDVLRELADALEKELPDEMDRTNIFGDTTTYFCPLCGMVVDHKSNYCPECGKRLVERLPKQKGYAK